MKRTHLVKYGISGFFSLALMSGLHACGPDYRLTVPNSVAIWPSTGFTSGGNSVTLTGRSFVAGVTVALGGNPCGNVTVLSPTLLTCVTPPGNVGSAQFVFSFPDQTSYSGAGFTYIEERVTSWDKDLAPYVDSFRVTDWSKLPDLSPAAPMAATIGSGVTYSPDSHLLAFGGHAAPFMALYDVVAGSFLPTPPVPPTSNAYTVAFSPDGSMLALALASPPYVMVYNTRDWSLIPAPVTLPTGTAYGAAFSPDGTKLAIAYNSAPYLLVYNTTGWTTQPAPALPAAGVAYAVAFSQDGQKLALASATAPYLVIYNTSDWSRDAGPGTLPTSAAQGLSFSPDGSLLAVAVNAAPYLQIYRTAGWSKLADPTTLPTGPGYGAAFNADGSKLAIAHSGSPFLTVYNTADWSKIANPSVLPAGNGVAVSFRPPAPKLPTLASVSPASGPVAGGTQVTLSGTGFTAGSVVFIGGKECTGVTVSSFTQLTCTTSPGSPGIAAVSVSVPGRGTQTLASGFAYF